MFQWVSFEEVKMMSHRSRCVSVCFVFVPLLALGCGTKNGAEHNRGVEKESVPPGSIRLSKEAQSHVGLQARKAVRKQIQETISTTGWLEVRPGAEVVVKAAATGYYLPDSENSGFSLGSLVEYGQSLGSLRVFVSPQEQAQLVAAKEEADILIKQSQVTRELAEGHLNRLKVAANGAVAGTRLMELEEIVRRSNVAEQEASDKLPFLPKEPYNDQPDLRPVSLTVPMAGHISKVHVSPRQLVIQGDPLWTIGDWSRLWVRVPVFEADLPRIVRRNSAAVNFPGTANFIEARPVNAAQPTEPGRRTVAVFYELDNASASLRPGQAVPVSLPTGDSTEALVVSQSAIVWDGMGNPWVYVQQESDTFRRQRVEVHPIPNGFRVDRGLRDGDNIVTVGAQALYGAEFAGQIQTGDNDD